MLNEKQKSKRYKRRASLYHPTQKMDTDEVITFRTKVSPDCRLGHKTFSVMKTSERDGATKSEEDRFIFYAIARRWWDFIELENPVLDRRYKNQIAAIRCGPGWIYQLDVYDNAELKIENEQGEFIDTTVNARKCGIGVVLTELCLIDSDIFEHDQHNLATQNLYKQRIDIHQNCDKLVGLDMDAVPPSNGLVYLSSGIRMGYTKLMVHLNCLSREGDAAIYNTYDIPVARDNYETLSGDITPCAGYERCKAWMKKWYLCDDTP